MSRAKTGTRTEEVPVGVSIAKAYLEKERPPQAGQKGTNRKSGAKTIREYADAMLRGEWKLTHQGIAFSEEDELIDGGHRLRAVVLADSEQPGIKVPFLVTTNVSKDAMAAMDLGKRRVPADFLQMRGEVNSTTLAGILRLIYCYLNVPYAHNESWSRYRITPTMQEEYLNDHPSIREAVYETYPLKKLFKPSAAGAFWFLATQEHKKEDVLEFVTQLRTGELLTKGDPALTLRELMLNSKAALRRFEASEELALLIKAFNKFIREEDSLLLAFRQDEQFPRLATA